MTKIEFQAWPKIARLNRDIVITEKIDGTNAAIGIRRVSNEEYLDIAGDADQMGGLVGLHDHGERNGWYHIYAQSRNRIITLTADNHGFAKWVHHNAVALTESLGEGLHFGEWWGSGIQRGYGLQKGEKRFSLFNTPRYGNPEKFNLAPLKDIGVDIVPVLYEGLFSEDEIHNSLKWLEVEGSQAEPGFMDPEGIIVFHTAAQIPFKVTIKNDEKPKGSNES